MVTGGRPEAIACSKSTASDAMSACRIAWTPSTLATVCIVKDGSGSVEIGNAVATAAGATPCAAAGMVAALPCVSWSMEHGTELAEACERQPHVAKYVMRASYMVLAWTELTLHAEHCGPSSPAGNDAAGSSRDPEATSTEAQGASSLPDGRNSTE